MAAGTLLSHKQRAGNNKSVWVKNHLGCPIDLFQVFGNKILINIEY